jgi:hypothetical protein
MITSSRISFVSEGGAEQPVCQPPPVSQNVQEALKKRGNKRSGAAASKPPGIFCPVLRNEIE